VCVTPTTCRPIVVSLTEKAHSGQLKHLSRRRRKIKAMVFETLILDTVDVYVIGVIVSDTVTHTVITFAMIKFIYTYVRRIQEIYLLYDSHFIKKHPQYRRSGSLVAS